MNSMRRQGSTKNFRRLSESQYQQEDESDNDEAPELKPSPEAVQKARAQQIIDVLVVE